MQKQQRSSAGAAIVPAALAETSTTTGGESAATFLHASGLGFLVGRFQEAGFSSTEDVLCLTPRKYEVLGVEALGTKLRLSRVVNEENARRDVEQRLRAERRREDEELENNRAHVRIGEELVQFRMPPASTIGDLRNAVGRQTGLSTKAFFFVGVGSKEQYSRVTKETATITFDDEFLLRKD